ncbi:MAG TPA: hypothetical protein VG675_13755 [Bryobacteraceae bacterium]|nr:hypothetical protein [Bryobacteraceae bacterium]
MKQETAIPIVALLALLAVEAFQLSAQTDTPAASTPSAAEEPSTTTPPPAEPGRSKIRPPKNRFQWMAKLRGDVTSAMTRATLDKKQMKGLEKSNETLRLAVEAHANKIKFNENEIQSALREIHKQFAGNVFQPADRDLVNADLEHLPLRPPRERRPRPIRPRRLPPWYY